MNLRSWREYIIIISIVLLVLGLVFLVFSFYGIFDSSASPDFISTFNKAVGDWIYWIFVLSIAIFLAGLYYTYDTIKKSREFFKYLNSDSKSKFISKLKDLEILADKLGPRHREMLEDKKKEWKVH
ncbi:MAG: DUF3198 domain-containing protein [Thermoplasmata archaeon]|nr:DUF3198 domain-containing protein [Thermoplasmata archaeon]